MKNKPFYGCLFILLSLLSSCGQSASSKIYLSVSNLYLNKNFEVKLYVNDTLTNYYLIDGDSYVDYISGKTYRHYTFLDGYQIYDENGIIDEEGNEDVSSLYTSLIDPLLYNETNFDIGTNYVLKKEAFSKFNFFFLDNNPSSFIVDKRDNNLTITCSDNQNDYLLEYIKSVKSIDYYDSMYHFNGDFYNSKLIDSVENYNTVLTENNDCVIIFNDHSCYYCEKSEKLYYDFAYEYQCLDKVFVMNVRTFDDSFKEELNNQVKNAYSSQDDMFKLSSYEEYPSSFLTPSALRYVNGNIKYVKPGFSINEKDTLLHLFFD